MNSIPSTPESSRVLPPGTGDPHTSTIYVWNDLGDITISALEDYTIYSIAAQSMEEPVIDYQLDEGQTVNYSFNNEKVYIQNLGPGLLLVSGMGVETDLFEEATFEASPFATIIK